MIVESVAPAFSNGEREELAKLGALQEDRDAAIGDWARRRRAELGASG